MYSLLHAPLYYIFISHYICNCVSSFLILIPLHHYAPLTVSCNINMPHDIPLSLCLIPIAHSPCLCRNLWPPALSASCHLWQQSRHTPVHPVWHLEPQSPVEMTRHYVHIPDTKCDRWTVNTAQPLDQLGFSNIITERFDCCGYSSLSMPQYSLLVCTGTHMGVKWDQKETVNGNSELEQI